MRTFLALFLLLVLVVLALFVVTARPTHAATGDGDYTAEDTVAAIDEASAEFGVSRAWLYRTIDCETGGTLNPYSVGRQGELGPAQLHPQGELRTFLAWGYSDPFSPYQAVRFMAQEFSYGRARAWTCS